MAEAQQHSAWNHTASLLAMIVNAHRDPKKGRAARPTDFHPLERRRPHGIPITRQNIHVLKQLLEPADPPGGAPPRGRKK